MMEIVYDMAPGVQLFFASAFNGEDSFADNIRLLRNTYHCDIIADDVSYSDEPVFQDGVIAKAVNDVTQDGALYFSSAGNEGNLTNGTSGTWEGDFNPSAAAGAPLPPGYTLHSFGASNFVRLTAATPDITLHWSDPLGNSSNDYDLFILNSAGTAVIGSSTTAQTGAGSNPIEEVFNGNGFPANARIVVVAKAGAQPRALHIGTFGGALQVSTSGETHGHNAPGRLPADGPELPGASLRRGRRGVEQRPRRDPRVCRRRRQSDRVLQLRWTPPHVLQTGRHPHHRRQFPVRHQWRRRAR